MFTAAVIIGLRSSVVPSELGGVRFMHGRYGNPDEVRRETNTLFRVGTDRIVGRRIIVGFVKDHAKPYPAKFIATLCGCSVRTAERYVTGEIDFPPEVYVWAMQRLHERE